jgi:hypothetical protein
MSIMSSIENGTFSPWNDIVDPMLSELGIIPQDVNDITLTKTINTPIAPVAPVKPQSNTWIYVIAGLVLFFAWRK